VPQAANVLQRFKKDLYPIYLCMNSWLLAPLTHNIISYFQEKSCCFGKHKWDSYSCTQIRRYVQLVKTVILFITYHNFIFSKQCYFVFSLVDVVRRLWPGRSRNHISKFFFT